jgi:hypothetical protein
VGFFISAVSFAIYQHARGVPMSLNLNGGVHRLQKSEVYIFDLHFHFRQR